MSDPNAVPPTTDPNASPAYPPEQPVEHDTLPGESVTGGQNVGPAINTPYGWDDVHPFVKEALADESRVGTRAWLQAAREAAEGKTLPTTTAGLYDHLLATSDLQPGEFGWLLLDPTGVPISLQRLPPDLGVPAAQCFVSMAAGSQFDALVSSSGAPLVPPLNPNTDFRFDYETVPPVQVKSRFAGQISAGAAAVEQVEQSRYSTQVQPR